MSKHSVSSIFFETNVKYHDAAPKVLGGSSCAVVVMILHAQVATPTFGDTAGAMVVLSDCVVSQGDTGTPFSSEARHMLDRHYIRACVRGDEEVKLNHQPLSIEPVLPVFGGYGWLPPRPVSLLVRMCTPTQGVQLRYAARFSMPLYGRGNFVLATGPGRRAQIL